MSARILVVDDSASMRQMVAFALTSAGFSVEEAEDGQDALGRAQAQRFNAVVTDVNMPRMDGISLIRALRGLPDYRFTPMLMLTTESCADKKSEGKAAGATGWLVKPFNPEQLVATIHKVLG
jgi:two-component system chemotaxis response regulator CheY